MTIYRGTGYNACIPRRQARTYFGAMPQPLTEAEEDRDFYRS